MRSYCCRRIDPATFVVPYECAATHRCKLLKERHFTLGSTRVLIDKCALQNFNWRRGRPPLKKEKLLSVKRANRGILDRIIRQAVITCHDRGP